jgi:hypothetical protein
MSIENETPAWELSKENVKPVRSGRRVTDIKCLGDSSISTTTLEK